MVTADTLLGASGLLLGTIQLLDTLYSRIKAATSPTRNLATDATQLGLDLSVERHMFECARDVLQTNDARIVGSLLGMRPQQRRLLHDTLRQLESQFQHVDTVSEIADSRGTPLSNLASSASLSRSVQRPLHETEIAFSADTEEFAGQNSEVPASLARSKWLGRDPAGSELFLARLHRLNANLRDLLPYEAKLVLDSGYPAAVLPKVTNERVLDRLEENLRQGDQGSDLGMCRRVLSDSLSLAQAGFDIDGAFRRLFIRSQELRLDDAVDQVPQRRDQLRVSLPNRGWVQGQLKNRSVIVEFRVIDDSCSLPQKEAAQTQIQKLAVLLAKGYGDRLHVMPLCGLYHLDLTRSRYGFLYDCGPYESQNKIEPISLEQVMGDKRFFLQADLGTRFLMALAIATAIMHLHACSWLHKGLNTSCIVYTQSANSPLDLCNPRLIGFEFSRPDGLGEQSVDQARDKGLNPFLPQEYQDAKTRYQRKHDYFALGVCLVCIGMWCPIRKLAQKFQEASGLVQTVNAGTWEMFLGRLAREQLLHSCGPLYSEVVVQCLNGEMQAGEVTGVESGSQMAFLHAVIRRLRSCKV